MFRSQDHLQGATFFLAKVTKTYDFSKEQVVWYPDVG